MGRFLDGSGAALGRLLADLGRLLGGSWAVLATKLGRLGGNLGASWSDFYAQVRPSWPKNQIKHGSSIKIAQKLKKIFSLYNFNDSEVEGIEVGRINRSCGVLEATWHGLVVS